MSEHSKEITDRILAERERQVQHEKWSIEHDDSHCNDELAQAAACYALGKTRLTTLLNDCRMNLNPFDDLFEHKLINKPRIRQLEIAGALIVAEIERLERLSENQKSQVEIE